jgi:hypothetical protein
LFSGSRFSVFAIEFRDDSRLIRIDKKAFAWSGLVSLTLPQSLEFVDGRAFDGCHVQSVKIAAGNRHLEMRDGFLVGIIDQRLIRYFGPNHDVKVPNDILILGKYCFFNCSNLTSISFGAGCNLKSIEHCAILNTDLASFEIPASVERISGSAFGGCTRRTMRVESGNLHFRIEGDFLLDLSGRELVSYAGGSSAVRIADEIEVLGSGCFYGHPHVVHCDFGSGSRLRCVCEGAFWNSSVMDITLPASVGRLERKAFLGTCHVSIPELPAEKRIQFRDWQCKHRLDASVVLDLTLQ